MKKIIFLSLSAIALVAGLNSCKKGENDPFLSLSSRKARICGEWKLTKEIYNSVENGSQMGTDYTTTTTSSYDGSTKTGTETIVVGSQTSTTELTPSSYTTELIIEKDGTFKMTNVDEQSTTVYEGNWMFLGKNKSSDLKKKEAIVLNYTKSTETDSNGNVSTNTSTGLMFFNNEVYVIDQLKSKEIVLKMESSSTDNSGYTDTYSSVYTYSAK